MNRFTIWFRSDVQNLIFSFIFRVYEYSNTFPYLYNVMLCYGNCLKDCKSKKFFFFIKSWFLRIFLWILFAVYGLLGLYGKR